MADTILRTLCSAYSRFSNNCHGAGSSSFSKQEGDLMRYRSYQSTTFSARVVFSILTVLFLFSPRSSSAEAIEDIVGSAIKVLEYMEGRQARLAERAAVLVCLRELSYSQHGHYRDSVGEIVSMVNGLASFTLINVGGIPVTVTEVRLTIAGTWRNGRKGGMGEQHAIIEQPVSAKGVASVNNIPFSGGFGIYNRTWVDHPEVVHLRAYWPGGSGPGINAVPATTTERGKWDSRILDTSDPSARRTLGENICY